MQLFDARAGRLAVLAGVLVLGTILPVRTAFAQG